MKNQKMPDGTCHGREPVDRGTVKDNARQYGVDGASAERGHTGGGRMSGTGSDGKQEGR